MTTSRIRWIAGLAALLVIAGGVALWVQQGTAILIAGFAAMCA